MASTHTFAKSDDDARREFKSLVNMSASQIETWLKTEESKSVGWSEDGGESVGHKSGRHIIRILGKKADALTDDDVAHMHKVVGYIKRHMAQKPKGDIENTRWRYSLMNWGHDPMKD